MPSHAGRSVLPAIRFASWALTLLVLGVSVAYGQPAADDAIPIVEPPPAIAGASEELATPDPRPRVAVLILATQESERAIADDLSELLVGAIAARGEHLIVGKEEVQAQLAQDDAATLACLASTPCVGRLGVQLGVVELIAGTLARHGDTWTFHLDRLDVRDGQVAGRAFREVRGDVGRLADVLNAAVPELYAVARELATLIVECNVDARVRIDEREVGRCGTSLRIDDLVPGRHVVVAEQPGHRTWSRTLELTDGREVHLDARLEAELEDRVQPLVWVGAAGAIATFGVGLGLGIASQQGLDLNRTDRESGVLTRAEALAFYAAREREAIAADLFFLAASLAATTALVALLFPQRVAASVALSPTGLRVRF